MLAAFVVNQTFLVSYPTIYNVITKQQGVLKQAVRAICKHINM
jgi:hypothetical protein